MTLICASTSSAAFRNSGLGGVTTGAVTGAVAAGPGGDTLCPVAAATPKASTKKSPASRFIPASSILDTRSRITGFLRHQPRGRRRAERSGRAEGEQDVAGNAEDGTETGVHEEHAAGDGGSATIQ